METLDRIASVLEVSVEELIYGAKKNTVEKTIESVKDVVMNVSKGSATSGIGFGAALAMVISYVKWNSVGWAIFHGLLNWFYVIYYLIKY